jgi:hypothetical protein
MKELRTMTIKRFALPLVVLLIALALITPALAAVWTDKADYSPGDVVTISGDNRDGAGYLPGETVHVDVSGPNGYTAACDGFAANDDNAAWSCQVTLAGDSFAWGLYNYKATGQTSSVSQTGTFTDLPKIGDVTLDPSSAIVFPGRNASFTVTVNRQQTGAQFAACLEILDLPAGWNYGFPDAIPYVDANHPDRSWPYSLDFPADVSQNSSGLTLTPPAGATSGSYSFRVRTWVCDQGGDTNDNASASGTVIVLEPLQVTKTAPTSLTRTYGWTIDKSVTPDTLNMFRGDSGTSNYTVSVTKDDGTDSDWRISGTIHVANPNATDLTVDITDQVADAGNNASCSVTNGTGVLVPKNGSADRDYVCAYPATPVPYAGTNKATASLTLDSSTFTFDGTQPFDFNSAAVNKVHDSVTVSDSNNPDGSPWTTSTGNSWQYSKTFTCDADSGTHGNTATIQETGQSKDASVTVKCFALEVTKDASTSFTRTYSWTIAKTADKSTLALVTNQTATVNYSIALGATYVDSAWAVNGNISVHNPAPIAAKINSVSDAVSGVGAATASCGVSFPYTLAASGTLNCTYSLGLPDASSRTNTATARQQNTPSGTTDFSGTAPVDFSQAKINEVDECATVTDDYSGGPQGVQVCYSDLPKTFTYARTIGPYPTPGTYTVKNTARFVTNDTEETGSSSWTVTVTVVPASVITNSSLCTFDFDPNTAGSQFRLIYTPDNTVPGASKLNASNPGQFFYNVFHPGNAAITLNVTVPYPFVTQGARPVHIYDGVALVTNPDGSYCLLPGNEITSYTTQVTLGNYSPQQMGSNYTFSVSLPAVPGGLAYVAIHLDYGLKPTTGLAKGGPSTNDAIKIGTTTVVVPDKQTYLFSFTDGVTSSASVGSFNEFKKNPGIGGLGLKKMADGSQGDPVGNVKVQIYDSANKLQATVYTDQDGWYMWQLKYTGKAATFTVKLPAYNKSQSATLKSNSFLVMSFTDLP